MGRESVTMGEGKKDTAMFSAKPLQRVRARPGRQSRSRGPSAEQDRVCPARAKIPEPWTFKEESSTGKGTGT